MIGVASYIETIQADQISGDKLKDLKLENETRWFGYRVDNVKGREPIEWAKWRRQVTALNTYYKASMSGLTVLQGKLNEPVEDKTIAKMVRSFRE